MGLSDCLIGWLGPRMAQCVQIYLLWFVFLTQIMRHTRGRIWCHWNRFGLLSILDLSQTMLNDWGCERWFWWIFARLQARWLKFSCLLTWKIVSQSTKLKNMNLQLDFAPSPSSLDPVMCYKDYLQILTNEKILIYGRKLNQISFSSFSTAIGSILISFDVLKSSRSIRSLSTPIWNTLHLVRAPIVKKSSHPAVEPLASVVVGTCE